MLGIYIHSPFCIKKCPYCDFYSVAANEGLIERYFAALTQDLQRWSGKSLTADTLYFGGGTPILLGTERIAFLIDTAKQSFGLEGAEITIELNPESVSDKQLEALAKQGVNRLSFGMQSAVNSELELLGRRHSAEQSLGIIRAAQSLGFANISVDWMLGTPNQNDCSIKRTADFINELDVQHVSAYMLKLEEGTAFFEQRETLNTADEDTLSDYYLLACELLEAQGFAQYEISNFAKASLKSRHNLKYWQLEDYLGFGPAAHSCFKGQRFYYPRDLHGYIAAPQAVEDGFVGGEDEYIMLALRLSEGILRKEWQVRFGGDIPSDLLRKAAELEQHGLLVCNEEGFRLSRKGFLLSNAVITYLT
ncbi:MAG: radical SAM family heme chaperone HemW [Oscillospiraceae bacterium]|jgi:oxygen-independent coproporphyrinogen-3 oxidase|nr:radical SAM family heme chaperone HemW [Oscillospiraceae bacterium]